MGGFFKWFHRRQAGPPQKADPSLTAGLQKAYDEGRNVSSTISQRVFAYVHVRVDKLRDDYLIILQKQIDHARGQQEQSPLLLALVDYSIFVQNVDSARATLIDETRSVIRKWTDVFDEVDSDFNKLLSKLIIQAVDDRLTTLKLEGLKVHTENVDILKRTDDNWRQRHPDRAREVPPPNELVFVARELLAWRGVFQRRGQGE